MRRQLTLAIVIIGLLISSRCLADDWAWTLLQPGASRISVLAGKAQVERKDEKFSAVLNSASPGLLPSSVTGTVRKGKASGIVEVSHSDAGPMLLKNGKWTLQRLEGGYAIETIWLHDPKNGHYLVLTRWVDKQR